MNVGPTIIQETFSEAFRMRYARLVVTAHDAYWLDAAVREVTGYASSVIACDSEVGLERMLEADETPDGRCGAAILVFGFSAEGLGQALIGRTGQCLMTCPTTAVYDGLTESEQRIPLGKQLRFFGDGFQKSKLIDGRRFWRVPVMDGEFLVEQSVGVAKGIGGGNIIIQGIDADSTLSAARRAVESVRNMPSVITPFPGGVARSGSKVGSRYKKLVASTADAYCPTLRGRVDTKLHPEGNIALEVVIDGEDEKSIGEALKTSIHAAAGEGIVAIGAGNYGGKLGKFHFHLHQLLGA